MEKEEKQEATPVEEQKKEKVNKKEKKNKHEQELLEKLKNLEEETLRAKADLINYRKRKDEEVSNLLKYSNHDILASLLKVQDNFERVINKDDLSGELKTYLEGFKLIYNQIKEILSANDVKEIEALGKQFEPVGILIAILIANGVSSISEYKQENKASALKEEEEAKETAKVIRDGKLAEIHVSEVVVGDIVYLQAGDKIAADGEIVEGEVKVDQAALNGETEEATKRPVNARKLSTLHH